MATATIAATPPFPFAESMRLNITSLLRGVLLPTSLVTLSDRADPQDDASADNVQVLLIGAAKAAVLRRLIVRNFNVGQVLAFRTEYLDSCGRCSVSMALAVYA